MKEEKLLGLIELEEMEFYAYHGCFEEEQVVGNRFLVNVSLETECAKATQTDDIQDALNYVAVYELVKEQIMQNSHLLEHLTKRMIDSIMAKFPYIIKLKVKVSKMNPPMGGQMRCVSVTLTN
ncbi:dihydroneopterin aldolase [Carboxylicivirga sp. N1Y90]|uniref:dihydroneopterin aldolase n=1 Tax=Carboxylicivirga fragile TaxID=3417571 RepID=UPI003D336882|nr:dihydroneopterin aldolase [Marinilabiliaceae bacterium N1Y90]